MNNSSTTANFYGYSSKELASLLEGQGLGPRTVRQLFNWHYKKRRFDPCVEDISKQALNFIGDGLSFHLPTLHTVREAQDNTVKFLFELSDGAMVETVLIPFNNKYSICLSSQVGCAMKCSFCHTGQQGLKRNLAANEIVGQFLLAYQWLNEKRGTSERILNIVFMGQGEPLHNFEAVKTACEIFLDQSGASIGAQKITVSTSGYLPGLRRWAQEMPGVNLALSLHSPFAQKRNELIPINRAYPLEEVLKEIDKIPLGKKQFVTFEYLLIADFNDSEEDARATGELLAGRRALLNIIPFNPIPGSEYKRPSQERVEQFKRWMEPFGFPVLERKTKGDEVMAACGQLSSKAAALHS